MSNRQFNAFAVESHRHIKRACIEAGADPLGATTATPFGYDPVPSTDAVETEDVAECQIGNSGKLRASLDPEREANSGLASRRRRPRSKAGTADAMHRRKATPKPDRPLATATSTTSGQAYCRRRARLVDLAARHDAKRSLPEAGPCRHFSACHGYLAGPPTKLLDPT